MTPDVPESWFNSLLAAGGALIGGGLYLRRRMSRDSVEGAKDAAETHLVSRLQAERDEAVAEARREREQRIDDARTIARLAAVNEHLASEKERMGRELRRVARGLTPEVRQVLETNFGNLEPR